MLFVLLFFTILSGTVLTFLFETDAPFWVRVCFGVPLSQVFLGVFGFIAAANLGMTQTSVWLAAAIVCLPLLLFLQAKIRTKFFNSLRENQASVTGFLSNATTGRFLTAITNAALFILLWFFFERAMIEKNGAIFTGGSQNYGDLPFHLGAITSFLDGQNFLPENPSFAGAKFTYPFIADFVTAQFVTLGSSIKDAFFWHNYLLAVALTGILYHFAFKLTGNRTAARLTPFIFLLSGGFGFVMFFKDASTGGKGVFELLQNLPDDYTIRAKGGWRWGNTLVTLFLTQRSLLLGMPVALIVLTKFWEVFNNSKFQIPNSDNYESSNLSQNSEILESPNNGILKSPNNGILGFWNPKIMDLWNLGIIGIFAGSLLLVHAHSFAVLMFVGGCLAVINWRNWRIWVVFFTGAALIAVPEFFWITSGSATRAKEFIDWHFGWDKGDENIAWFWLKNTGFFIPLLLAAVYFLAFPVGAKNSVTKDGAELENSGSATRLERSRLLLFYLPFAVCFIVPNIIKLAPWEWDNIKVLVYWHVASVPLAALVLADMWKRETVWKFIGGALFGSLIFAGFLDVWRTASGAVSYEVFSADAVKIAAEIKQKTLPKALFLNAPTFNTAVVLSGRRSLMRYTGHLFSHGIDYADRESDLREIYRGSPMADYLLKKYEIEYVLISPEEFSTLENKVNESFFSKFPVVAESGQYRVYKVR